VTTSGRVLYQHPQPQGQTLVAPFVAAGMTDLMQTAVNIGTGRAAQIGRPVAGKTGTTSSNKDGWFMGFSSGITTGVWMGRDDAKPVPGLQGGTAPARAWAQYMRTAVAGRPPEPFDTQLKLPEWQLEPDDQAGMGDPNAYFSPDDQGNLVGPNGQPLPPQQSPQPGAGDADQQQPVPEAPLVQQPQPVPAAPKKKPTAQPGFGIY
jgi:penicillin-binding protein 1A